MKFRQGFVSNSSSSSFVIRGDVKTSELARKMIDIIEEENLEHSPEWASAFYPGAIKWLAEHSDYDGPIVIPWSTNYDTWIARSRDNHDVLVDTCNNHEWFAGLGRDLFSTNTNKYTDGLYGDPGNLLLASDAERFLDLSTLQLITESDYQSLWQRDECSHKPEPDSITHDPGMGLVIDINCSKCGTSGSYTIESDDILW